MMRAVGGAVLAAGVLAAGTAGAVTMTAVIEGTITAGVDETGVFGTANTSLDGKAVTVTYTFDPDLAPARDTLTEFDQAYGGPGYGLALFPSVLAQITIGGFTRQVTGTHYGYFISIDDAYFGYDVWYGIVYDLTQVAGNLTVNSFIQTNFRDRSEYLPLGLEEPFSLAALPLTVENYNRFLIEESDGFGGDVTYAYGDFNVTSIRVSRADVSPVPLPASVWMLLAGAGGIVAAGRRRKPQACA